MPFPYQQTREVYSVPPEGGIAVNPTGYVPADGVPYPRQPRAPRQPNDPMDLLRDKTMDMDEGIGDAPPRDPYMAGLPPRQPAAPMAPPVTTLQPGRTSPFSRADAQALAALDPRALDEAKAIAAMPESTPAKITGSFGGKSFEMQPSARVDRNALARLYAQAQERKGQERQDAVRGQEQGGRERIVSIPGEQQNKRREMELGTEERIAGKKIESDAPVRAADIAAKGAQTAAAVGAEQRAAAQAARQPSPQQEAIDAALAEAQASPFAQTPEGRARIAALYKRSTVGSAAPETTVAPPAIGVDEAVAEVMADPGIAAIIERAKKTEPGFATGSQGRQTGAAARNLAERAIRARLARAGVAPEDAQEAITAILGAQAQSGPSFGRIATDPLRILPGGGMIADALVGK